MEPFRRSCSGGFEGEFRVVSGSRTYVSEGLRRMSKNDPTVFKWVLEEIVGH